MQLRARSIPLIYSSLALLPLITVIGEMKISYFFIPSDWSLANCWPCDIRPLANKSAVPFIFPMLMHVRSLNIHAVILLSSIKRSNKNLIKHCARAPGVLLSGEFGNRISHHWRNVREIEANVLWNMLHHEIRSNDSTVTVDQSYETRFLE